MYAKVLKASVLIMMSEKIPEDEIWKSCWSLGMNKIFAN
jgi:hypothetical protein